MISPEDINLANPDVGIQDLKAELAAEGKTIADISDAELNKRARQIGLDEDQMQSQYSIKRRPGEGYGFDKVKQRTAAQIIRGNREPPPAFFDGIPEAMQQALAGINQQRIGNEVPTDNNYIDRDRKPSTNVSIPAETGRGKVVPPFRADSTVRGLLNKDLRNLAVDPVQDQVGTTPGSRGFIPNIDREMESLRAQQGSLAAGEAMMGSPPTSGRGELGDNRSVLGDVRQAMQNQGDLDVLKMDSASKAFDRLNVEERKVEERNQRIADVVTQDAQAIGRENSPEERAEVLNKETVTAYDAQYPDTPIEENLEEFKRIQEQIYSETYEQIFKKQGLSEDEVGLVVDPNTGLFTAVPEPEAQETSYEANPRRVKYIQENIDDPDTLDFANFLIRLEENDEIGKSQRSAIKRLTGEITQRSTMGMPLTKEMLSKLQEDSRFKGAFNAINRIKDDDPEILENVFNAMEVAGAIPMLAPVGRGALLARAGVKGVRNLLGLAAKSKSPTTGGFKATAQRSAQATGPGSGGVVFTSQQGGRTTATVQVVKTRPGVVTNVPKGTKAGLRRVGDKFAEQPRKGTRGNLKAENAPAPLGGNRKAVLFAVPFDNSSEEEIEASTEFQNDTINYVIGLERFSEKPYEDGKLADGSQRYSIGYGTISEKGAKSISEQEASQLMQTYLQNEVYPEIDYIKENGAYNLNEDQMTALSSLIYNVGSPAWRTSKAREALLEGNLEVFIEQAFSGPTAFGTGSQEKFIGGLEKRRQKEAALFNLYKSPPVPTVPESDLG
jgi:GH24 family phage-related lysozyme (muramidase)